MKMTVKKDVTTSESEQILNIAVKSLDDGKAVDITVIDLVGISSIAAYMVIASGTSQRHVASLAEQVYKKLKDAGFKSVMEGEEKADWVLIDAYDVIIHVFKPEVREFYNIEKMWSAIAEIRKVGEKQ